MLNCSANAAPGLTLYVAPDGNDLWSGRFPAPTQNGSNGPLATLEAARDRIRGLQRIDGLPAGGVVVEVRGIIRRDKTFELNAADSGTAQAPVIYRGASGGEARLWGGHRLSNWRPVEAGATVARLAPSARGQVFQTDLKAQGITDYGKFDSRGHGGVGAPTTTPELFFASKPMQLARWPNATRWPNEGYEHIAASGGADRFKYSGDRPARWANHKDIWLHGYWTMDWGFNTVDVASIDTASKEIVTKAPHGIYGYRPGGRFFYTNILEELDTPGEWYIDREAGLLYFWPPAPLKADSEVVLSTLAAPIINLNDANHVQLERLTLEYSRGIGTRMSGGRNNQVNGCTITNIGTSGVEIYGGYDHTVRSCDINNVGGYGVWIGAGIRSSLALSGHLVHNCHFHHIARESRTYFAAIHFAHDTSGGTATNNLIHDMVHTGIFFHANDIRMEYNELYNVVLEGDDAGAMYAGRDWTYRGNVLRHNFVHHTGGSMRLPHSFGTMGIYLDDCAGGTLIENNIFQHVSKAVFAGGGRDTKTRHNIFIDCAPAYHIDERGFAGGSGDTMVYGTMKERFYRHKANESPFADRYPDMLKIHALYEAGKGIAPEGCSFEGNFVTGSPVKWMSSPWVTLPEHFTMRDNLIDRDPRFVDRAWGDFRLRPDSPVRRNGFEPTSFEKIGLVKDEFRRQIERVESRLDIVRPITATPDGGATGRVRLTLRNRGDVAVADVEHIGVKTIVPNFIQGFVLAAKQVASVAGDPSWNFRLAPGAQATREWEITMPAGAARDFSLLQIDTRGERARPARTRTSVAYALANEVELVRPLSSSAPGRVRVTTRNRSAQVASDNLTFNLEPAGVARIGTTEHAVRVTANGSSVHEFDIALQPEPGKEAGAMLPGLRLSVAAGQAQPVLLRVPVERPIAPIQPVLFIDNLATTLPAQPAYSIFPINRTVEAKPFGDFRFGIAGNALALFGRIADPRIETTPLIWTGSSIEVFGNMPGGDKVGQIFLVPASGGAPARAFRQQGNDALPAPEIQVSSRAVNGGYEISALIPLQLIAVEAAAQVFRFEVQVTTGTDAGPGTRRGNIFGSAKAYADFSDYGTVRRSK